MAKTRQRASRAQSYFPVKIPVYSLSGGVGRQIPSKRLPTEVDELINFQCTTESSLTKRNGTEVVGNLIVNTDPDDTEDPISKFLPNAIEDLFFYWQTVDSETSRLYTIISPDAYSTSDTFDPEFYIKVFEISLSDNTITSLGVGEVGLNLDSLDYLQYKSSTKPMRERLKAVTIGSSVLILNTDVHAGFTSRLDGTDSDNADEDDDGNILFGRLKDFDGTALTDKDVAGADIQYLTSIAVDHQHNAEVWVESQDYTYGQQVIDSNDPVDQIDTNGQNYPFIDFRGVIWDEGRIQRGGQLRFDFTDPVILTYFTAPGSTGQYEQTNPEIFNQITLIGINSDGNSVTRTYICNSSVSPLGGNGSILSDPDGSTPDPYLSGNWRVRGRCISVNRGYNIHGPDGDEAATAEELANGSADATSLVAAINNANGHNGILKAYANQISVEDTTEYPGRVIIQQLWGVYGEQTNTTVWINNFTTVGEGGTPSVTYNLNLHTKSSIDNTFSGGGDPSIHDVFEPTWDGSWGASSYWFQVFVGEDIAQHQIFHRHGIWQVKTYLPAEEIPGQTNKLLSESEEDPRGSILPPYLDLKRWERVETKEGDTDLVDNIEGIDVSCNVHVSSFIPVEEYVYPVSLSAYLGQSVTRFSDLRFPPDDSDLKAHNGVGENPWAGHIPNDPGSGSWEENENALTALYPDDDQVHAQFPNAYNGRGKIYHLSQAYLNNTPGWYRVINKDTPPYLKKIRTPGKRTILDKRRMPQMLYVDDEGDYNLRQIEWDPRESGDEDSNRGPGLFFDPATEEPKESKINTMAFYRDRLFLANDDTIVASRAGNWDNFFLADPDNITDTDPLDLMVSSNNYTPITQLVPFRSTLFVGTSGNTQYELQGSNNIISPTTAEFAPTAFYPMLPEVPPVLLNNSLFFYSKEKLYVYLGGRKVAAEQAFELSKHIPQYLPKEIRDTTTSSHASSIFALDNLEDGVIFVYRNQIAGEKVIQNAFYKFRADMGEENQPYLDLGTTGTEQIIFLQCWDKYLYLINHNTLNIEDPTESCVSLRRLSLDEEPINIPRLDNLRTISPSWITLPVYDPDTNRTTLILSWSASKADTIITEEGTYGSFPTKDEGGDIIHLRYEGQTTPESDLMDKYSVAGDQASSGYYELFRYIGNTFVSTATLSPIYLRDEMNNLVPGTLNLRYGTIQTYDSRAFDVEVSVNNRNQTTYNFDHEISDDRWIDDYIGKLTLSGDISEHQVRFPILGFTEDVKITIISSNPHPLNIASLQFSGKFKGITRFHNS